jgi:hypothetical protein
MRGGPTAKQEPQHHIMGCLCPPLCFPCSLPGAFQNTPPPPPARLHLPPSPHSPPPHLQPLFRGQLVGAQLAPHGILQHLCCRPREAAQPRSLELSQVGGQGQAQGGSALQHRYHWHSTAMISHVLNDKPLVMNGDGLGKKSPGEPPPPFHSGLLKVRVHIQGLHLFIKICPPLPTCSPPPF